MDASTREGGAPRAVRRGGGRAAAIATLAVGALLLAGGLAVTLSRADVRTAGTDDVTVSGIVATLHGGDRVCQDGERVPAGAAAIALSADHAGGPAPALTVELLDAATRARIAAGTTAVAWGLSTASVPLHPPVVRERAVRVCVALGARSSGTARLLGAPAQGAQSATVRGTPLGGRLRVEYRRASAESWWAFAPTVVDRIGRGHAWSGASVALLAGLLTLTSILLAAWLLVRAS